MMSKTHLCVGALWALAIAPNNPIACTAAIAMGGFGGVAPDVDIVSLKSKNDVLVCQLTGLIGAACLLYASKLFDFGIGLNPNEEEVWMGGAGFVFLYLIGAWTNHRSFTHSILALFLFTVCVNLISPSLAVYFAIGYLSHLMLDLLNRRGIQLFFPLDSRICLHLCYAKGAANRFLMSASLITIPILFASKIWVW